MNMKRIVTTIFAVSACLALSACHWHAVVGHSKAKGSYAEVGVEGDFSLLMSPMAEFSSNSINPSDLYINITTSNTNLVTNNGNFVVKLFDSGDNLIAANTFSFYRSGNRLLPSDPSSVASWADGYPSAASVKVYVSHLSFHDAQSGTATMQVSAIYNGQEKASASQSWIAHGGFNGSCGNGANCNIL